MKVVNSATEGENYTCPCCEGLIWVNLSWPGLPFWEYTEDGGIDRPFGCPWCGSVLIVGPMNKISTQKTNFNLRMLGSSDLIIISEDQLSSLIFSLLKNVAVRISDSNKFVIGRPFDSEEEFKLWCSGVTGQIRTSNKIVRLPVIDI